MAEKLEKKKPITTNLKLSTINLLVKNAKKESRSVSSYLQVFLDKHLKELQEFKI